MKNKNANLYNPLLIVPLFCTLICVAYTVFLVPAGRFNNASYVSSELSTQAIININEASWEELALLPGIGNKRAEDIVAYRELYGPFQSVEDILKVSGIGTSIFEEIRDIICV